MTRFGGLSSPTLGDSDGVALAVCVVDGRSWRRAGTRAWSSHVGHGADIERGQRGFYGLATNA